MIINLKKHHFLALGIASTLLIASCGGNKNAEHAEHAEEAVDTSGIEELKEDVEKFNYILPSPLQIASLFNKAGLKYNEALLNPLKNQSKYNNEFDRTINIGTYGADLAYALLNNQTQYSLNCLKSIKELSDAIGMGSIYSSENYIVRFKNNINKFDSLVDIFNNLTVDTKAYLAENEKKTSSLLVFAGGWIESMHIATKSIENVDNEKILRRLSEQHVTLEALIKLFEEETDHNEQLDELITDLKSIATIYNECADYKAKMSTAEEGTDVLDFEMSKEEKVKLSAKIAEIRSKTIES